MISKYERLKEKICNYRTVCGDGNCYYRAVMFRYIELLILNKKCDYFKLLIIDIYKSFQEKEIQKRLVIGKEAISPNRITEIMLFISTLLENNKIVEAHQVFYKCLIYSKSFDFSLILYFRYLLYIYIKKMKTNYIQKHFLLY
jgi:hypothetical protein